jgi:hypothetical protein
MSTPAVSAPPVPPNHIRIPDLATHVFSPFGAQRADKHAAEETPEPKASKKSKKHKHVEPEPEVVEVAVKSKEDKAHKKSKKAKE